MAAATSSRVNRASSRASCGVKDNLKENIAQFVPEGIVVFAVDGVQSFIGLFDQIGFEALVRLLPVPGTSVGAAQTGHQLDETIEFGHTGILDKAGAGPRAEKWRSRTPFSPTTNYVGGLRESTPFGNAGVRKLEICR